MSILSKKLSEITRKILEYINDNKMFLATASNKIKSPENIFLDESEEIIRTEIKVANVFNKYL